MRRLADRTALKAEQRIKGGVSVLDARIDGAEIVSRLVGTLRGLSRSLAQQGGRSDDVTGKQGHAPAFNLSAPSRQSLVICNQMGVSSSLKTSRRVGRGTPAASA